MTADHTRPGGDASEFLLPTLPPLAPLEERVWVPNEVLAACSSVLAGVRRPRRRSSGSGSAVASIGVTSSEHGEGRTTVAHGLAVAQRNEYGRKTVLLDFGGDGDDSTGGLGLNAVLDGEVRVLDAVAWVAPHLGVLRATASFDGASTLVSRFRASSALADLLSAGYAVVADLPPLPPAGAADRVAGMFDTVVLVVRAGVTSLDAVRASLKFLDQEPVVILNGTKSSVPRWLASGEGS